MPLSTPSWLAALLPVRVGARRADKAEVEEAMGAGYLLLDPNLPSMATVASQNTTPGGPLTPADRPLAAVEHAAGMVGPRRQVCERVLATRHQQGRDGFRGAGAASGQLALVVAACGVQPNRRAGGGHCWGNGWHAALSWLL